MERRLCVLPQRSHPPGLQSFSFQGFQGQDVLAELIEEAYTQGLLVIPWFEFGFMAPPTSELALKRADCLTHKRDGGTASVSAAGEWFG